MLSKCTMACYNTQHARVLTESTSALFGYVCLCVYICVCTHRSEPSQDLSPQAITHPPNPTHTHTPCFQHTTVSLYSTEVLKSPMVSLRTGRRLLSSPVPLQVHHYCHLTDNHLKRAFASHVFIAGRTQRLSQELRLVNDYSSRVGFN